LKCVPVDLIFKTAAKKRLNDVSSPLEQGGQPSLCNQ